MAHKQQQIKRSNQNLLFGSILFFMLLTMFALSKEINGLELTVFRAINNLPDVLRPVFIAVTQLGGVWFFFILVLFLLLRHHKTMAVRFFATGVCTYFLTEVFKHGVGRMRPDLLLAGVHLRELPIGSYGFPSGHTALATVMSILLLRLFAPKLWRPLAVVWILSVGFSRIYLGVHAPLDIIGGFTLGFTVVVAERLLHKSERFLKKYV